MTHGYIHGGLDINNAETQHKYFFQTNGSAQDDDEMFVCSRFKDHRILLHH